VSEAQTSSDLSVEPYPGVLGPVVAQDLDPESVPSATLKLSFLAAGVRCFRQRVVRFDLGVLEAVETAMGKNVFEIFQELLKIIPQPAEGEERPDAAAVMRSINATNIVWLNRFMRACLGVTDEVFRLEVAPFVHKRVAVALMECFMLAVLQLMGEGKAVKKAPAQLGISETGPASS